MEEKATFYSENRRVTPNSFVYLRNIYLIYLNHLRTFFYHSDLIKVDYVYYNAYTTLRFLFFTGFVFVLFLVVLLNF